MTRSSHRVSLSRRCSACRAASTCRRLPCAMRRLSAMPAERTIAPCTDGGQIPPQFEGGAAAPTADADLGYTRRTPPSTLPPLCPAIPPPAIPLPCGHARRPAPGKQRIVCLVTPTPTQHTSVEAAQRPRRRQPGGRLTSMKKRKRGADLSLYMRAKSLGQSNSSFMSVKPYIVSGRGQAR